MYLYLESFSQKMLIDAVVSFCNHHKDMHLTIEGMGYSPSSFVTEKGKKNMFFYAVLKDHSDTFEDLRSYGLRLDYYSKISEELCRDGYMVVDAYNGFAHPKNSFTDILLYLLTTCRGSFTKMEWEAFNMFLKNNTKPELQEDANRFIVLINILFIREEIKC